MSNHWQDDIDEMMIEFGQECRIEPNEPQVTKQEIEFRKKIMREEFDELLEALEHPENLAHIAKELADLLVTTIGTGSCLGIELDPIWRIVHDSNMKKVGGPKDPVTGKQLKPEGWVNPEEKIQKELIRQGWNK